MTTRACRSGRKHTPIVSGRQARLFGAAYGARKAGKGKPKYVPASLWKEPKTVLKSHLTEYGSKIRHGGSISETVGRKKGRKK